MDPGKLKYRVTIQIEQRAPDDLGGYAKTWGDVATVWGNVRPLRSDRALEHGALTGRTLYAVDIRYRPGLRQGMRVLWENRVLKVQGVTDLRPYLELLCEEDS